MRVQRRRTASEDLVVVTGARDGTASALRDLGFAADAGEHVRRFAAGTLDDETVDRLRHCLAHMLGQATGREPVPWESALVEAADRLTSVGAGWWLTGSAALAARGEDVEPRDVDLVVSLEDAARAAAAFADVQVEPAGETAGWVARWFGRAWLGARVEWVAGVEASVDLPEPVDFGPAAAAALEEIAWRDSSLRVPPLDLQRRAAQRRGLAERVRRIDSFTSASRSRDGG